MKKILALLLAVMTACSAFAAVSAADEKINATFLYVATDGSDAANGSADAPFATLQKAVEAAGYDKGFEKGIEQGVEQGIEYNIPYNVDTIKKGYPILCA